MSRSFEVFYHPDDYDLNDSGSEEAGLYDPGWYYWWCEPGCLPDSEPIGPFPVYWAAQKEATEELEDVH